MKPRLSFSEVKALFEKISNWGKWGKDDQSGALNFITNAKRAAAARLVQTGEAVSIALPLSTAAASDNPTPVTHLMVHGGVDADRSGMAFSDDYIAIAPHGYATTHLDALCHLFWEGKMYNGFDAGEVRSFGAQKCAVDVARNGVVSRGVLLDIPKIKKLEWLEPEARIYPEDLDAAEKDHGIAVQEGDVLLIRTGRTKLRRAKGSWQGEEPQLAGLDASCLGWLHERSIAVLGSDGVSDVMPSGYPEIIGPIHAGTLVKMGVHLIDNCDLEVLAAACSRLARYEFQFVMEPLILLRGTCSPVNPLAIL